MKDATQLTLRITSRLRVNLMFWWAGQCVITPTIIAFLITHTFMLAWLRFSVSVTYDPARDSVPAAKKTYEKLFILGNRLRVLLEHRGDSTYRTVIPALFYIPLDTYAQDWTFSWLTSGITLRIRCKYHE